MQKTKIPSVSIIVLTFNALEFTRQCIASVKKYSKDYELIVVDNGSDQETVEWLKSQRGMKKIFNSENKGFAGGNNQGIRLARGKYVLLLNSDVVVTKNWLGKLIDDAEEEKGIALVGPYSNQAIGDQIIPTSYISIKQMHSFAEDFNLKGRETTHISGFCVLIKRNALNKVGLFDERFKVGRYEDVDYCIRFMKAGYKLKVANCFIHHFGSRSFIDNIDRIDSAQSYEKNRKRLFRKWPEREVQKAIPS